MTYQREKHGSNWRFICPALPARILRQNIPRDVSAFIDFSTDRSVSYIVTKFLPSHCTLLDASKLIGNELYLQHGVSIKDVRDALDGAWWSAASSGIPLESTEVISLADVSKYAAIKEPLAVIDRNVHAVPAQARPVDENEIFRSDKTYLLIGLPGEVGQFLAAWMVSHGARNVVLASRKPVVDPEFIYSFEMKGANIQAMPLDITGRESIVKCLRDISYYARHCWCRQWRSGCG